MVRSRGIVASAIEIAIDGAINLWLVPAVAIATLAILARRRDAPSMRASRLALFALAVGGAMPLLYTTRRIAIMSSRQGTEPSWLVGAWVMSAGLLLCAAWSARVGTSKRLRRASGGPG